MWSTLFLPGQRAKQALLCSPHVPVIAPDCALPCGVFFFAKRNAMVGPWPTFLSFQLLCRSFLGEMFGCGVSWCLTTGEW